jgi:hypothetical protein
MNAPDDLLDAGRLVFLTNGDKKDDVTIAEN